MNLIRPQQEIWPRRSRIIVPGRGSREKPRREGVVKGWTPCREITIVIPITIVIITYGRQLGGSMGYTTIIWDMDDDPDGNVQHIAQHDLPRKKWKTP